MRCSDNRGCVAGGVGLQRAAPQQLAVHGGHGGNEPGDGTTSRGGELNAGRQPQSTAGVHTENHDGRLATGGGLNLHRLHRRRSDWVEPDRKAQTSSGALLCVEGTTSAMWYGWSSSMVADVCDAGNAPVATASWCTPASRFTLAVK